MTKQEAEEFFARHPSVLETMNRLQREGFLEKMDLFFPVGSDPSIKTEEDAKVNCVEAFRALSRPT